MELEFDKEIDALLRKARDSERLAKTGSAHLDADAVASFAENALPQRTRQLYTEHLADCGRCRKLLSQAILMNEAAFATEPAAVVAPAAAAAELWYARLFRLPKLATMMGGLVILFAGVLTVLVIQNRRSEPNSTVSQIADAEKQRSAPYASNAPAAAANSTNTMSMAANSNAMTANTLARDGIVTAPETGATSIDSVANSAGYGAPVGGKPVDAFKEDKTATLDAAKPPSQPGVVAAEPKPMIVGAPPPASPPTTTGGVAADEKKVEERRQETESSKLAAKTKDADDARSRRVDSPAAAAKRGPARTGPLQDRSNQTNVQQMGEMSVTRKVGGRTFTNQNGAWYDATYHGQATSNYSRGTAEYGKLDKGLRSIANELGGTVVVVWKGTAYRIR